jgi:microcystin degradation protein MlrC
VQALAALLNIFVAYRTMPHVDHDATQVCTA